jgi:uncharacterized MnhB-related membrane protein
MSYLQSDIDDPHHKVLVVLTSIIIVGLIAIPIGNQRFIDRAIALEVSFIVLAILVWWRGCRRKALYVCIGLAVAVIIGNSLAPRHVELMITFAKPINSIVLIFGGYILQAVLLYTSLRAIVSSLLLLLFQYPDVYLNRKTYWLI